MKVEDGLPVFSDETYCDQNRVKLYRMLDFLNLTERVILVLSWTRSMWFHPHVY